MFRLLFGETNRLVAFKTMQFSLFIRYALFFWHRVQVWMAELASRRAWTAIRCAPWLYSFQSLPTRNRSAFKCCRVRRRLS